MLIISFESKIRRVLIMVKKEESGRKGGSVIIIPPYLSATNRKNDSEALRRTRVIFFYHTNPLINLFRANPFYWPTCKNVLPSSRNSLKGGSVSERFLNSDHPARPNCWAPVIPHTGVVTPSLEKENTFNSIYQAIYNYYVVNDKHVSNRINGPKRDELTYLRSVSPREDRLFGHVGVETRTAPSRLGLCCSRNQQRCILESSRTLLFFWKIYLRWINYRKKRR